VRCRSACALHGVFAFNDFARIMSAEPPRHRTPEELIAALRRLRDDADAVIERTRALCSEVDQRLTEATALLRAPMRRLRQKSRNIRRAG
jgi:hypothetical protein